MIHSCNINFCCYNVIKMKLYNSSILSRNENRIIASLFHEFVIHIGAKLEEDHFLTKRTSNQFVIMKN